MDQEPHNIEPPSEDEASPKPPSRGREWLEAQLRTLQDSVLKAREAVGAGIENYLSDPARNILLSGVVVQAICSGMSSLTGHPDVALQHISTALSQAGAVWLLGMYRNSKTEPEEINE